VSDTKKLQLAYEGKKGAPKVLIVDDEKNTCFMLEKLLEAEFTVASVYSAEAAIPYLEKNPPDVVLADKNLPRMTGLALLKKVKDLGLDTEVVMITAYASIESAINALRLGAFDYLTKPFQTLDLVLEKVLRASEKKRLVVERREAQAALRESEKTYRALVESSADGIVLLDSKGTILKANQQIARLHGFEDPQELVGKNVLDLVTEDQREFATQELERAHQTGVVHQVEITLLREDGTRFVGAATASAISMTADKPGGFVGIVRDVTEAKKMHARLAQADRMASVGVLAAGVAHEINNPLAYVLYNLQSLAEDLPKVTCALSQCWSVLMAQLGAERALEVLGDARDLCEKGQLDDLVDRASEAAEGAERVRRIVRELKSFSRTEGEALAPVSVNQVLESALNMAQNQIRYRARVVKDLGDNPVIMASDGRLAQVFLNLLVNAAHAIEEGDIDHNEIQIRTWSSDKKVFVEVRDTGRGIPREHLDRLFDPFFSTKPRAEGSGLGLSICQNTVGAMGGSIEVESEEGKGSRFTVTLPIPTSEVEPETPEETPDESQGPAVLHGRILVVDDEPLIGATIRRVLKGQHDVVVAQSGADGKSILEEDQAFDLILCDLMMPGLSGMDLHEWLAGVSLKLADRMVFITGGAFTPKARAFVSATRNILVDKPFDPKNLRALVSGLIGQQGAGSSRTKGS
jgi:PAS domain S-box-containing protein